MRVIEAMLPTHGCDDARPQVLSRSYGQKEADDRRQVGAGGCGGLLLQVAVAGGRAFILRKSSISRHGNGYGRDEAI